MAKNVYGSELSSCSLDPLTGFYRTGCCDTGADDVGEHTICIRATEEFLAFSKEQGNDLSTPNPDFEFPGVKPGDRWCLCLDRWLQALEAGVAPRVVLRATHESVLHKVDIEVLEMHAVADA